MISYRNIYHYRFVHVCMYSHVLTSIVNNYYHSISKVIGFDPGDFVGTKLLDYFHPADYQKMIPCEKLREWNCTYMYMQTQVHTYMHAHTHTRTHARMHTHTQCSTPVTL